MKKRLAGIILVLLSANAAAAATTPHIVFILADDMGVGDVSVLNTQAKVKTPNIDRLAAEGMVFSDAHTSSSVCTPTRYGLMTGRYSWRSELKERVVAGYSPAIIPPDRDTVASLLKRQGYNTAMIGKWHLGLNWQRKDGAPIPRLSRESLCDQIDFSRPFSGGPCDLGFSYYFGHNASLDFPPYAFLEYNRVVEVPTEHRSRQGGKKSGQPQTMMRRGLQVSGFRPELVLKKLTDKAVEFIEQQDADSPFFLYLPLNAPHTPVVPRKKFNGTSECGIYGDFIQEIDWSVGKVVAALRHKGFFENTLIIFSADNGASKMSYPIDLEKKFGHKPSGIFSGRKGTLYEGGHRVPFIVGWSEVVRAGSRCDVACNLNDFYATCAALVGEEIAPNAAEDSFNMLPLLLGKPEEYRRNGMVHHDFGGRFAIREGKWKLVLAKNHKTRALFDLESDPSEKNNLISKHPEVAEQLEQQLTKIIQDGRSTPGPVQQNDDPQWWPQLYWMARINDSNEAGR